MMRSVDRVAGQVPQGVVHPAHVPLEAEAQAAVIGGPRHHGPRGGFLGEGRNIRKIGVHAAVQLVQQRDRPEVLAPAVLVRDPLAVVARVVAVEHRSDCVDAYAVRVVPVEPEVRARQQEAAYLVAVVVEDQALPVGVEPETRIGVFIEVRSVELRERVLVIREMRRHPVEDDPDATLVQVIDERHEALRRSIARRGRKVARCLISPRPVEGVLHQWQQLDVGEPAPFDMVGQRATQRDVVVLHAP